MIEGVLHLRVPSFDRPMHQLGINFFDLLYTMRVLRKLPPADILVTNTFWLPILQRRLSRGKTYIHVARYPRRQMSLYHHAARFQAVSRVIGNAIIRQTLSIKDRVKVIPNSLPHDFLISGEARSKTKNDRFEILYVGRIHAEKGIEILLEAYKRFVDTTSFQSRLRIVGPDATNCGGGGNAYRRSLQESVDSVGGVEWCDPVFDSKSLQRFYSEADVMVYPSIAAKGEASPLTPVEAMASGCVPIVSDLECFADYLKPDINGLVFSLVPDPVENLVSALHRAAERDDAFDRMREECLKTAEQYSLKNVASLYERDFLGIMAGGNESFEISNVEASEPLLTK